MPNRIYTLHGLDCEFAVDGRASPFVRVTGMSDPAAVTEWLEELEHKAVRRVISHPLSILEADAMDKRRRE